MNYQLDIKNFLKQLEPDANTCTVSTLVLAYYRHKGITDKTTTKQWMVGLAEKSYPNLTESYSIIKQNLKDNKWKN